MEAIKDAFAQCKKEQRSALVTYVTAGFPTTEDTVSILLGMEAGGAGELSCITMACRIELRVFRSYRTWPAFYRSHCGRSNYSESKYTGVEEWRHGDFDLGSCQGSTKTRFEGACAIHGLL